MTDKHRTDPPELCKPVIQREIFLNVNIEHLEAPWCPVVLRPEEAESILQLVRRLHERGHWFFDQDKIVSLIEQQYRNKPGWWLERCK